MHRKNISAHHLAKQIFGKKYQLRNPNSITLSTLPQKKRSKVFQLHADNQHLHLAIREILCNNQGNIYIQHKCVCNTKKVSAIKGIVKFVENIERLVYFQVTFMQNQGELAALLRHNEKK